MKVSQAVISVVAAVVTGVGGGVVFAQTRAHTEQPTSQPQPGSAAPSARTTPSGTPSASRGTPAANGGTPAASDGTPAATPATVDQLSEENLIRQRLYYDVTGHSFSVPVPTMDNPQDEPLGPCTGQTTFADVLPTKGVEQLGTVLAGSDVTRVTEILAQTRSSAKARAAADEIVTMVGECPAIQGGDFGYGDPVTVHSDADRKVVYFPGYDSDRRYGGYIVFSVGNRVGVVSVSDLLGEQKVSHLASEAAGIASK